jgi:GLPGLI family protein
MVAKPAIFTSTKLLTMKNIYLLILFFLFHLTFGQNKQFLYEYTFIPDSTNIADILTEMMVLNVQKDRSEYYSSVRYSSDSAQFADYQKGINSMPRGNALVNEWVTKYPNSNQIFHTTFLISDKYKVKQEIQLDWKLTNEFSKILNYDVQKATTEFGGRKWTAWFTKEIPIPDGPYKFKGLPGLILKIEDSGRNHVFELRGIKSNQEPFIYPNLNNYRIVELNYSQFIKKYKNYRQNPTADLVGQIPDQHDSNGKWRTSSEIIKEINQQALERLAKDNNLIELNLLK